MCPAADPPPVWGRGRGEQNHAGTAGLCPSHFVTAPGNAGLVSRLNQMGVDGSLHTFKNQFSLCQISHIPGCQQCRFQWEQDAMGTGY